jgi:lipid A 3-O-deacylase
LSNHSPLHVDRRSASRHTNHFFALPFVFLMLLLLLSASSALAQVGPPEPSAILAAKPWRAGVFFTGGFAEGYRDVQLLQVPFPGEPPVKLTAPIALDVFNAGVSVGKVITSPAGPSFLRGQLELGADLLPYWQAHYPRQSLTYHFSNGPGFPEGTGRTAPIPSQNRFGISFTPFLLRWNFSPAGRVVPWAQLGGGLLWTNHKFPQYPIPTSDTSVINFTPQAGIGANIFVKPRQSLFFAANAVHISSAGLGDRNPGVNVTTQFTVGYWFWK